MIYKKIKDYIIPPKEIYNNYVSQKRNGRTIIFYKKLLEEKNELYFKKIKSRLEKISECNQYWELDFYKNQEIKVFNRTNLCNDKFCANCRKVKQSLRFERFKPLLLEHKENLYHLVLTVPNCYGDNLYETIQSMFKSFRYLIRYLNGTKKIKGLDFNVLGYKGALRSLEVTSNNDTYHAHLHVGIVLEGSINFSKTNINKFSFSNRSKKITRFSNLEVLIQKIWYLLNTNKRVTFNNINSLHEEDIYSCKLDNTINKRLNCLKRAFINAGLNTRDLFFTLKIEYKTFGFLTEKEINILIDYVVKSKMAIKNKLLVLLTLESGARKKELLEIKISNIDKINEVILLETTKEKRPRFVCYGKLTKLYLDKVILSSKNNYLFDISSNSFSLIFKRIKKRLNFKKFSAYVLRHTYATILINNNSNLNMIMITMGHKNIATTQRYLHYNRKLVKLEYEKGFKIEF